MVENLKIVLKILKCSSESQKVRKTEVVRTPRFRNFHQDLNNFI